MYLDCGRMEAHALGIPFSLVFDIVRLRYTVQVMLLCSLVLRESLLLSLAVPVLPHEEDYEWPKTMTVHSTSVNCVVHHSHSLPNQTIDEYGMGVSIGHGLYIFGFIGILIILKSLLTKIMMVENKPEDSAYIITFCESPPDLYKVTLQKHNKNNNVPVASSSLRHLSPPRNALPSSPVLYGGSQRFPLPSLDGGDEYCVEQCPFSSPQGSTKCLM